MIWIVQRNAILTDSSNFSNVQKYIMYSIITLSLVSGFILSCYIVGTSITVWWVCKIAAGSLLVWLFLMNFYKVKVVNLRDVDHIV